MKKKTAIAITSSAGILCVAVLPFLIGTIRQKDIPDGLRVNYLMGLSTLFDWVGVDFYAFDLEFNARKVHFDLLPLEVTFRNDLESRLIRAEAEVIEPNIHVWGMEGVSYSSGEGLHRFYVPEAKLDNFERAMIAYKTGLEHRLSTGGGGYVLESVNMNKMLEWLGSTAGLRYYRNPHLDDPYYEITGRIADVVDPESEIDEIAKAFRLNTRIKNGTLIAWCPVQHAEPIVRTENELPEQGGAGQPATRSELESEGSDKPQPKSEGRSR